MQNESLIDNIKHQVETLSAQEKFLLANYLLERVKQDKQETQLVNISDDDIRRRRMEWLKSHREEYAGQYVALDGDVLVGHGATIGEADKQAKAKGIVSPFLVRVTSENEVLFAGW